MATISVYNAGEEVLGILQMNFNWLSNYMIEDEVRILWSMRWIENHEVSGSIPGGGKIIFDKEKTFLISKNLPTGGQTYLVPVLVGGSMYQLIGVCAS